MWKKSLLIFLFSLSVQGTQDPGKQQKPKECIAPLHLTAKKEVRKGQQVNLSCAFTLESHQNTSLKINYSLFLNTHLKARKTAEKNTTFNISISTASDLGPYKCKAQIPNLNSIKYSNSFNFTLVDDAPCPLCLKLLLPAMLLVLLAVILTLVFWILCKYKARLRRRRRYWCLLEEIDKQQDDSVDTGKAMKENALRVCEDKPKEDVIYTTVKKKHAEAGPGPGSGPKPCVPTAEEETGPAQEIHYATPLFPDVAPGGRNGDPCTTDHVYSDLIL